MGKFWLKIWIWIKVIFALAVIGYLMIFVFENHDNTANIWVWFGPPMILNSVVLTLAAFAAGLVAAFLLRTALRTVRQLRDLKSRSKDHKTLREQEDAKAKAAMLRTKPPGQAGDKSA